MLASRPPHSRRVTSAIFRPSVFCPRPCLTSRHRSPLVAVVVLVVSAHVYHVSAQDHSHFPLGGRGGGRGGDRGRGGFGGGRGGDRGGRGGGFGGTISSVYMHFLIFCR